MRKSNGRRLSRTAISFVIIFMFVAGLTGCEPLRKKFTRQKKKVQESEEIPILEPIEYPKTVLTAEALYKKSYGLWKIWHGELSDSIVDSTNRKRQLYFLNQVVSTLSQMQVLLVPELQGGLKDAIAKLAKLQAQIESPVVIRAATSIKTDIDLLEKKIRMEYIFDKVKNSIQALPENSP